MKVEWFKRLIAQVGSLWGKWSMFQRMILAGIVLAVVVGTGVLVSSSPSMVPLINAPIRDEVVLDRIVVRLDQEGVNYTVTGDNRIMVPDRTTSRRMIAILAREDLIPQGIDPWEIFDRERWIVTDM